MNPYQENVDIVKGFFRKKLILFYAILTILPIFSVLFIKTDELIEVVQTLDKHNLLSSFNQNVNLAGVISSAYILFIFEILISVVFLLFFVKADNDDSSLNFPIKMFSVVSLIELIVTAIIALAMVLLIFLFSLYFIANFSELTNIMFIPFMFASIPIMLVTLFAQVVFSNSIKESVNSIYLKKSGAKLYGVMNIILAALCVYFAVLLALHGLPKTNAVIPLLVFFGLAAVRYLVGGIVGIKYSKYIESFSDSSTSREEPSEPEEETDNIIVCEKCGNPLNPDDYFCNHCGTPVEK